MKRLICLLSLGVFLAAASVQAQQGAAIFEAQRCGTCHKPDIAKAGPSLAEMGQAYQEKEGLLVGYLKGEAEPLIEWGKGSLMKRAIEKTKALSDADRRALAEFIISHKP
jgi:cytochrome c551/c552